MTKKELTAMFIPVLEKANLSLLQIDTNPYVTDDEEISDGCELSARVSLSGEGGYMKIEFSGDTAIDCYNDFIFNLKEELEERAYSITQAADALYMALAK